MSDNRLVAVIATLVCVSIVAAIALGVRHCSDMKTKCINAAESDLMLENCRRGA